MTRWGTGCAFLDYDRDGMLDLFVANYIDLDLKTAPTPDSGLCRFKGVQVACGPPGLKGGTQRALSQPRRRHVRGRVRRVGHPSSSGTYGLGVSTLDFDNDGWTDFYVANDSNPSALYRNRHDGTFEDIGVRAGCAYSQDGKPQAGMGVGIGDYRSQRHDGHPEDELRRRHDVAVRQRRRHGFCEDRTFDCGTRPEHAAGSAGGPASRTSTTTAGSTSSSPTATCIRKSAAAHRGRLRAAQGGVPQRRAAGSKTSASGSGRRSTTPKAGRGTAFGDLDGNGTMDVAINNVHDAPDVFLTTAPAECHWLLLRLVGTTVEPRARSAHAFEWSSR